MRVALRRTQSRTHDDGVGPLVLACVAAMQVQEDRTSLQSKVKELQAAVEQWETKEAQWEASEAQRASEASASAATAELQAALDRASELHKTVEVLSGQLSDAQATAAAGARRLQETQEELTVALTKVGEGERATVRLQSELRVAMEDGMAAERRAQVRRSDERKRLPSDVVGRSESTQRTEIPGPTLAPTQKVPEADRGRLAWVRAKLRLGERELLQ